MIIEPTDDDAFPRRDPPRPDVSDRIPHSQLSQNPSRELYDELAARMATLPDANIEPSRISVPGARALVLKDDIQSAPGAVFVIGREFAHLHPLRDGSLHMILPRELVDSAIEKGWAEPHPLAGRRLPENFVMVYGPRDDAELDFVFQLVLESYVQAGGRHDTVDA